MSESKWIPPDDPQFVMPEPVCFGEWKDSVRKPSVDCWLFARRLMYEDTPKGAGR